MECDNLNNFPIRDFILSDYNESFNPFDLFNYKSETVTNSQISFNQSINSQNIKKVFNIKKQKKNEIKKLPLKDRMEIKKQRAKNRFLEKRIEIDKISKIIENNDENLEFKKKRQLISMRNRCSSQRSRDKKKRLFEEMKNENHNLKTQLLEYENIISRTCFKCKDLFIKSEAICNTSIKSFIRYGFVTSLFVIVCIVGNVFTSFRFGETTVIERNLLKKENINIPLILTLPDYTNNYSNNKTIHEKNNLTNSKLNSSKLMIVQKIKNSEENYINISTNTNSIQKNILSDQRGMFLRNMNHRLKSQNTQLNSFDSTLGFLNENIQNYSTCINPHKMFWSSQNSLINNSYKISNNPSIYPNANSSEKSVIPIHDVYLEMNLMNSVKSVYCNSPIWFNSNEKMFSKLLKRLDDLRLEGESR